MLERNMAQAIALVTDFNWDTLETTASIKKLHNVSTYAAKIKPPRWNEEILGKINVEFAEEGKQIFKKECLSCHSTNKPSGIASIEYNYLDVGTDAEYIKAQQESFYGKDFFSEVLAPWMKDVKLASAKREGITDLSKYEIGREYVFWRKPDKVRYAAKPLYGVWATAPYLHNASVLNMSELLKPSKDRLKSFYVGSFEYDSLNLGFTNEQRWYSSKFEVDCKACRGNSNAGHEFGVNLTSHQKFALIEFLKSYTEETVFE
jgi:cytochrome c1